MVALIALSLLLLLSVADGVGVGGYAKIPIERKFILITDMLNDDRGAMLILSRYLEAPAEQLRLVGLSTMNTWLKKAVAERLYAQLRPKAIEPGRILEGRIGRGPEDYPNISTSNALYSYVTEGDDVFDVQQLVGGHEPSKLMPWMLELERKIHGGANNELTIGLRKELTELKNHKQKAEIIGLTSLTELAQALHGHEDLVEAIYKVHFAGGWSEVQGHHCSSMNFNFDPAASDLIFQLANTGKFDLLLYPSKTVKETFGILGLLRSDVVPMNDEAMKLIQVLECAGQKRSPPFVDFFTTNPSFNAIWGAYESERTQIAYSDMVPVIGIIDEAFVKHKEARRAFFKREEATTTDKQHARTAVFGDWSEYIRLDKITGKKVDEHSTGQCGFALKVENLGAHGEHGHDATADSGHTTKHHSTPKHIGIHEVLELDGKIFYEVAIQAFKEVTEETQEINDVSLC